MGENGWVTRGLVFPLDVSPSEERLLVSYCGARRFAYNWVLGLVSENLRVRRAERAAGVVEDSLTLRRQLDYKTTDYGHTSLPLDRFFPSSKTCSNCDRAKAKLALSERVFRCERCGHVADRDVNAARTIHNEAQRLLDQQHDQQSVAGLRPETQNADRRRRKTRKAQADMAAVA